MTNRSLLLLVAAPLVALDLGQKASAPVYGHPRSVVFEAGAALLVLALVALVPRVPSRALAYAGGVATAGAFGNLVSALTWSDGVPNPIVAGGFAFNVADLCAVAGAASLVLGAAVFGLRNPHLLRQPV